MESFRLLFIGAGFSRLAGLPLGNELFKGVRSLAEKRYGKNNVIERDLLRFVKYKRDCDNKDLKPEKVNFEEFLSFLEIEDYFAPASDEKVSLSIVRRFIGQLLLDSTPMGKDIPSVYRRFVQQLSSNDWIVTFNYDTLLEETLEAEGVPYCLFPYQYSEIHVTHSVIDNLPPKKLVVLKLHGSVDWFSRFDFDDRIRIREEWSEVISYDVNDPIFGSDRIVNSSPIAAGLRDPNASLTKIYRVQNARLLYEHVQPFWQCDPVILVPSSTKIISSGHLRELWNLLPGRGSNNLTVGIIGYSLPNYDYYVRQIIYDVINNFIRFEPDLSFSGRSKSKLRILDYRITQKKVAELRAHYRFVDWEQAEVRLDGFNETNADWILS